MGKIIFNLYQKVDTVEDADDIHSFLLKEHLDVYLKNDIVKFNYPEIEITKNEQILLVHPNINKQARKYLNKSYANILTINEPDLDDKIQTIKTHSKYLFFQEYKSCAKHENGKFTSFSTDLKDYKEHPNHVLFLHLCYKSLTKGFYYRTIEHLELNLLDFKHEIFLEIELGDYLSKKIVEKISWSIKNLTKRRLFKQKLLEPFEEGQMVLTWSCDY